MAFSHGLPPAREGHLLLLGAGASKEAGIPTTFEMTEALVRRLGERPGGQTTQALHFVCGAILAYDAAQGASPYAGLDVERVFAAVELLAARADLEVTPFVSSWHPAVDAWDRPSPPMGFDRDIQRHLMEEHGRGLERAISRLIDSKTGVGAGRTYEHLAEKMIDALREMLGTREKAVSYLSPLAEAARRPGGLTVASLNYDLSIEQMGHAEGVPVSTGLGEWSKHRRWMWPPEGLRLMKLHGSIDWCWEASEAGPGDLPRRHVVETDEPSGDRRAPALIFGQRGKLRAEGPFLSLLSEFEEHLSSASCLIAVGYSFRDEHINQAVTHWVSEDSERTIVLVDPHLPERLSSGDFRGRLERYLNRSSWDRQSEAPERLTILRTQASVAFRQLFSSSPV